MKGLKLIALLVVLTLIFPTLVFAGADNNTSPTITPKTTSNSTPLVNLPVNMGQLVPGALYEDGLVSNMDMSAYSDYKNNKVNIDVRDSKVYNTAQATGYGFVYPEMTVTIQRKAEGEIVYASIGTASYTVTSYIQPYTSLTHTNGTASYVDLNVEIGRTYSYRIKHTYEGKTYYTAPKSVSFPIEDSSMLKLRKAKRVELYFDDTWKPAAGDVYKYELKRELGMSGYKTVAQLDLNNRYISDIIIDPVPGGYYYYVITATCTASTNSSKIGQSITSEPIKIEIEE